MKFLHLKPQMQPLSIRSSDIAFTMGAKGPLWERVKHFDGEIPLFRERETRKMKESIIYVHGKGGSAEEADHYKPLFPNCEVIGFDYRSQTPWEAKEEFLAFFAQQRQRCDRLILIAGSIGAFFSIIPYVIEQTSRGERSYDIFSRLLSDRIIFLGEEVTDASASSIAAQMLFLEAQDPVTDIQIVTEQMQKTKQRLTRILSENTGRPFAQVAADTERDNYMSAQEALAYGLIDKMIDKR